MVLENVRSRLVVDDRIDNVRNVIDDIRGEGLWPAWNTLASGFGSNNRRLIGKVTGR